MSVWVDTGIDKWYKASCHPIWGSLYMYWNEIIVYMCFLTRSCCSVIFCHNDTTAHLTSACDHVVMGRKEVKVFISEFWRSRKIRYDSVTVLILFLFCFPEFLSVCLMKVITNDQERESSSFAQTGTLAIPPVIFSGSTSVPHWLITDLLNLGTVPPPSWRNFFPSSIGSWESWFTALAQFGKC